LGSCWQLIWLLVGESIKASLVLAFDGYADPEMVCSLDIKGIEHVINYEMPKSIEIYLHRVGRTARAGKKGRYAQTSTLPFSPSF